MSAATHRRLDRVRDPWTAGVGLRAALWGNRWLGAGAAMALASLLALASSVPMPRGPVTSAQALLVIATSLMVGGLAGYAARTRWALILAPIAYIVVYELSRRGLAGASVAPIRLDSTYGIVALVVGRGFHGLIALVPMAAGISLGAALAGRGGPRRSRRRSVFTWTPRVLLTATVIGLAVVVALPASTPPVAGSDGRPLAGSIAEISTVRLGGQDQTILVRAANPDNPVLLYLSGGPGQSDLAFGRVLLEPLVSDFVVVVYDQRGTGRSYPVLDPASSLTLEQAVSDTIALTEHLRQRFGEERVYLLGESWGSTLGVLAVQQRPDLFHAYIGSGQMVSQRVTDQIIWRDLLAYAERVGDWALYDQVLTFGEPPYRDIPWANGFVLGYYDALTTPYTPPAAYIERGVGSGVGPFGIFASEYGFVDKANVLRGLLDMFTIMYPQIQGVDFRADVPALDVPVYILDGAHELRGRRDLAHEWFERLDAPSKAMVTYENAGHSVVFEEVDAFRALMVEEIVPATYGREPGAPD
jgi:proline iminopeptidase